MNAKMLYYLHYTAGYAIARMLTCALLRVWYVHLIGPGKEGDVRDCNFPSILEVRSWNRSIL
jgi:hypothetical protein